MNPFDGLAGFLPDRLARSDRDDATDLSSPNAWTTKPSIGVACTPVPSPATIRFLPPARQPPSAVNQTAVNHWSFPLASYSFSHPSEAGAGGTDEDGVASAHATTIVAPAIICRGQPAGGARV